MPTYQRFEDLPVWNQAIDLAEAIYELTQDSGFKGQYSLRDQIERAAVSVSNNIAEGFERGTTNELLMFIYIARGSSGEVRSMLCLIERLKRFSDLNSQIPNIKLTAESCSRQLRAWADHLQNSDISGQRHLNEKVRRKTANRKAADDWQGNAMAQLPKDHPMRIDYEKKHGPLE